MKYCHGCKTNYPLVEFTKDSFRKDGLTTRCKHCRNKVQRKWYKNNLDKIKIKQDKQKENRKRYYSDEANKLRYKNMELKRTFGISLEDYNRMLKVQNNNCFICLTPNLSKHYKYLAVDHCHKTGKVRGLLCYLCNGAIGMLKDDIKNLERAIVYLQRK